ncbi:exonuclease domain-containing protein [Mycobacterium sp. SM1]|uniref:exonuclease domain-containing protein n=1 Tax=Mycobacterium sp. SM1 TaxID=2816243 RepID=UPI0027DBB12E|nr:exonuclease domain-containing protein [Mycobacterium sp. SM1]
MGAPRWAVVDVETSGLDLERDRVVSIAALAVDDDGIIADSVVSLLDPGVPPGPTDLHGITAEMLTGWPRFGEIAVRLAGLLRGRVLVAHYADFDFRFLMDEFRRTPVPCPVEALMCTVELSRRLGLPVRDHKLSTLARYWRVPQARPHDAFDDARVLAAILARSLKRAQDRGMALPVRAVCVER